jgi:ketosteroid isomerase-like protein
MTQASVVDHLRERDQAIDSAMSNRNRDQLESLLAEDFIYTHSNGRAQPKPEFIAAILQRSDPPRRLLSDVQVELHADIAVTHGDLDIHYHDNRPSLFMRYVRVYRHAGNEWRAISHRTVYATDRNPK